MIQILLGSGPTKRNPFGFVQSHNICFAIALNAMTWMDDRHNSNRSSSNICIVMLVVLEVVVVLV